jgi:hypothetical protein
LIRLGVLLLVAGGVVIALPDADDRLFSISETHGPSPLDAAGIVVVFAGWALLLRVIWLGRGAVRRSRGFLAGIVLLGVGVALLTVGVLLDLGWWWLAGAALMASVQGAALGVAARATNSP